MLLAFITIDKETTAISYLTIPPIGNSKLSSKVKLIKDAVSLTI